MTTNIRSMLQITQKRYSDSVIGPSVASAGVSKNRFLPCFIPIVYHFRAALSRGL